MQMSLPMPKELSVRVTNEFNMPYICKELFREVCILANGEVVCSSVDGIGRNVLGNIYQDHIKDIFNGKNYRESRQKILESGDDSHCPVLRYNCCHKTSLLSELDNEPKIEVIMLETTSYCNLKCPSCAVPMWVELGNKIHYHPRLGQIPIEIIEEVFVETKDTLKQILLFNYGEPFLDNRLIEILRLAKRITPSVRIITSTNGTVMKKSWPETIVKEGLIDSITFSIDGASQETYGKYRVGGNFDKAFKNMVEVIKYKKLYKKSAPEVIWQYILFEWNDSDSELKRAQDLASYNGLSIVWVLTHTEGKSRRFKPISEEYQKLDGVKAHSAGIAVPGHGNRYLGSNKVDSPTEVSKVKAICMDFFRIGGGLGDDVANGLLVASLIVFVFILFMPVYSLIKFSIIAMCILSMRAYRQKEKYMLEKEFINVFGMPSQGLREYVQAFLDSYYDKDKVYSRPLDINQFFNGKFKKLLYYEAILDEPKAGYARKFCNIIDKSIFLRIPIN
jgi:wyosine [tRNA(Phe)-imidazoG37] synthetase (radical SAM superfamily)